MDPAHGHEMTRLPSIDARTIDASSHIDRQDATSSALLRPEKKEDPEYGTASTKRATRNILRLFRLQTLANIFGRIPWKSEPRKIAMYHSRRIAAYHCSLHLIPMSAAVALLTPRWTGYWIGMVPPDTTILQFVAKFHELLMQVSLVEVTLCIVRSAAIDGFVPLGTLSAALQPTQLSYLWSLDFFSMLTSMSLQRRAWRRTAIAIAIPCLLILMALLGPSSAVLMIPEPGCAKLHKQVD